jgi:23S rRNA (guanosine2251-2'-O)-methyltransferase
MRAVAILHDIRSVINVGAIFRTCDAAGISKIYLTGITPAPLDRFGRTRADLSKAALGAEKSVAWEHESDTTAVLDALKKDDFKIIGIEQSERSVDYKKIAEKIVPGDYVAFLVGNEVGGIPPALLKKCDFVAEIPMKGKKESLNVSTAFGIAVFRILDI